MRQWLISALKTVLAQKLPLAIASLSPVLAGATLYLHDVIAPHLSDPTGWLALKSIAISGALLPLPFAVFFYFRPNLKFNVRTGTWIDNKTKIHFCAKCKINDKTSPLKNNIYSWQCMACDSVFFDSDRPQPVGALPYGGNPL